MELIINLLKDESMKAAIIGALGSIVGGFIGVIGEKCSPQNMENLTLKGHYIAQSAFCQPKLVII